MRTLKRPRIKTPRQAWRCVHAVVTYLRKHESPLTSEDLQDAVNIIRLQAMKLGKRL